MLHTLVSTTCLRHQQTTADATKVKMIFSAAVLIGNLCSNMQGYDCPPWELLNNIIIIIIFFIAVITVDLDHLRTSLVQLGRGRGGRQGEAAAQLVTQSPGGALRNTVTELHKPTYGSQHSTAQHSTAQHSTAQHAQHDPSARHSKTMLRQSYSAFSKTGKSKVAEANLRGIGVGASSRLMSNGSGGYQCVAQLHDRLFTWKMPFTPLVPKAIWSARLMPLVATPAASGAGALALPFASGCVASPSSSAARSTVRLACRGVSSSSEDSLSKSQGRGPAAGTTTIMGEAVLSQTARAVYHTKAHAKSHECSCISSKGYHSDDRVHTQSKTLEVRLIR